MTLIRNGLIAFGLLVSSIFTAEAAQNVGNNNTESAIADRGGHHGYYGGGHNYYGGGRNYYRHNYYRPYGGSYYYGRPYYRNYSYSYPSYYYDGYYYNSSYPYYYYDDGYYYGNDGLSIRFGL